ncbi:chromate transport protein ChrA [Halalkalibacter wakoensis JCM 9140]|uniref:Chromate transport protein ChrA n=1 Tax=Halalkalibacter wakoensis JCM 9140 TaxID=1236970 RepID=W4Q3Z2_9BACI|nr:chromate efflux transporter [Halalkalibacter wakoensis]GAE26675.1 chromate transport protein ChrA [Halalkalibacter wakoensis JCM 9140]
MEKPSLWNIFWTYILIGLQGWGGPAAQIQVIHEHAVEKKKWIDNERFRDAFAVCGMLPGPEAAELCMYVGYRQRGYLGGFLAGLGFMLPNFILITLLAWAYFQYAATSEIAQGLLYGVKPAMVAIVLFSLFRIANKFGVLQDTKKIFITIFMLSLTFITQIDLILLLLVMGFIYMVLTRSFKNKTLSINILPLFALTSVGTSSVTTSLSLLFLKVGALSFGGAYTVLALLQFEAVDNYGWLTTEQYIDGLAINELTPGPLIMVAAFVGFAAYGFWGATLATFFIFLPAFLIVLLGAPYFDKIRENEKLKVYLAGISAAVVGLIASFLIRLSLEVFYDGGSIVIALITLGLLFKFKWQIWQVFLLALVLGTLLIFI